MHGKPPVGVRGRLRRPRRYFLWCFGGYAAKTPQKIGAWGVAPRTLHIPWQDLAPSWVATQTSLPTTIDPQRPLAALRVIHQRRGVVVADANPGADLFGGAEQVRNVDEAIRDIGKFG